MNAPHLSECMKTARKKLGMTQEELAKQLGVATVTVRQYESGSREPKMDTVKNIARILHIDPVDLFFNTEEVINLVFGDLPHGSDKQPLNAEQIADRKIEVFKAAAQLAGFAIDWNEEPYQLREISTGDILARDLSPQEIAKAVNDLINYAGSLCVQLSDLYKKYSGGLSIPELADEYRNDSDDSDAVPDSGEETPAGE